MTPPDSIWTEPPDIFDGMGLWYDNPHPRLTEYRRADLPPTLAQALDLPEIAAIVAAAQLFVYAYKGDDDRIIEAYYAADTALAKVRP
jgi:hypothetical protein